MAVSYACLQGGTVSTVDTRTNAFRVLIVLAAFVIVVAGMRAAASLIVPFLLAAFIAIICSHPLLWMKSRRFPTWAALLVIILGIGIFGGLIALVIGDSIADFRGNLPYYQTRLESQVTSIQEWLESSLGIEISTDTFDSYFDVSSIMGLVTGMLSGLGGMLTNGFMILLTAIFMLLEASAIPAKIRMALGDKVRQTGSLDRFMRTVKRYMAIKSVTSLATGVLVYLALLILGVDFPILWGLLAFLLNFVPTIGSIIAAVPAVILAFIQLGIGPSLLTALCYLIVNNLIGTIVEPKFMGKGVGLSTLVVFVSLVFWGWILGPIGMFLSVPLTMTVKIALENDEKSRWLAVLLGSETGEEAAVESKS